MKVMHVIHGFNTGGAETIVKQYVTGINKKHFEIVVLCFEHHKNSPYEKEIEMAGIKVIYICDYIKYFEKRNILYKIINFIQRYYYVKKFIHKEKPSVIHSHLKLNRYIKFANPKIGTRIYHTVHSEPKSFWKSTNDSDFKAAQWLVKKYGMKFIVLHKEMQNEVNKMFNVNDSIVLNNGINFAKFETALPKVKIRKNLRISNNFFVVGHIGRFNEVKNHSFLIDVFNEIYKKNNNAFLLLIGDGPEKEKIEAKLKKFNLDNHYMILSNRNDIPDLLNAMDVFVFPSLYEGLGISLIEAQKMKLLCFVSEMIPEAAIISNLVTKLPLDNDYKKWADRILETKKPDKIILNDEAWDIKKVISKLEKIYIEK